MSFVVSWLTPRCRGSGDRNVAEGQVQGEEIQAPGLWELWRQASDARSGGEGQTREGLGEDRT